MKRISRHFFAMLAALLLCGVGVAAPVPYAVTPYQPTGSTTYVSGLNDHGHSVGRYSVFNPELGNARWAHFLSYGPDFVDLGSRGVHFEPSGLNNRGQIVGTVRDQASGRVRSYFYTGSEVRAIDSLGGHATVATAVNDRGQVAGYSALSAWEYRAFIYQDGVTRAIGSPGGPDRVSGAFDINQRGQVVGEWVDEQLRKRAFLYDEGVMTDLGTLGGDAARATSISNTGHVLGLSESASGAMRSFVWFNGSMTELASASGGWFSANGVNSAGDIVGAADSQASIRTGGMMYKLNDLQTPGSGWSLGEALAINDRGQIAAFGCKDGMGCTSVLLTPVPEAGILPMLLAGLALVVWSGWRRARASVPTNPRHRALPLRRRAATLALLAGAGGAATAMAATPLSFTVSQLTGPPGLSYGVADVNNAGQLAGFFSAPGGNHHAYLQPGKKLLDLGTLGGWTSSAQDLNNAGDVIGRADAPVSGSPRAFLYTRGAMHDLGTLGGDATYAMAINDVGQVVGYSHTLSGHQRGFLYAAGRMTDLGTLAANGGPSYASDINNAAQITGHWVDRQGYQRAFIYEAGSMKDIGTLGGRWSYGSALNDAGDIVGVAETSRGNIRGFVRRGGYLTDLVPPGGASSQAIDINSAGDIIGMAYGEQGGPFIWRDGLMGMLNDYLVPGSGLAIAEVSRINDKGQILASGCRSGGCVPILLSPVPEPAAFALLIAGLLVLSQRVRRARR